MLIKDSMQFIITIVHIFQVNIEHRHDILTTLILVQIFLALRKNEKRYLICKNCVLSSDVPYLISIEFIVMTTVKYAVK